MSAIPKGQKIGLALGGGAVLGAAHVGVLRALVERDIEIGWITGTSIGSLIASLYAFGEDVTQIKDLALDLGWTDISNLALSKRGLLSNDKVREFLDEKIGSVTFADANIPLAIITADISSGEKVVLTEGDVASAVMASMSIPGLFEPVEINDRLLVDGGIVENVPVTPLDDLGADFTVAVDLNSEHSTRRPENLVDVLINSFHYALQTIAKLQTADVDVLITPDLSDFNHVETDQAEALMERGYQETKKMLNA